MSLFDPVYFLGLYYGRSRSNASLLSSPRCGFCYLEIEVVPAGVYNIIPTTFLPQQEGPFFLDFNSCSTLKTSQLQWGSLEWVFSVMAELKQPAGGFAGEPGKKQILSRRCTFFRESPPSEWWSIPFPQSRGEAWEGLALNCGKLESRQGECLNGYLNLILLV